MKNKHGHGHRDPGREFHSEPKLKAPKVGNHITNKLWPVPDMLKHRSENDERPYNPVGKM